MYNKNKNVYKEMIYTERPLKSYHPEEPYPIPYNTCLLLKADI